MIFQYFKENIGGRRQRTGIFIAEKRDDYVVAAFSKCRIKDSTHKTDKFDKIRGISIAKGRIDKIISDGETYVDQVPQSIQKDFHKFIERATRYYQTQPRY